MTTQLPNEGLLDLERHVRLTIPLAKTITRLEFRNEIQSITFHWQGRDFLVRKNLEALETRGNQLFVTGASMLVQSALMSHTKSEKVLGAVLDIVKEAESLLSSRQRGDAALKLLATAKSSLAKLSGRHHSMMI